MKNERNAVIPTLGLACTARPTFAVEAAQEAAKNALEQLQALGWPIIGNDDLLMDAPSARNAAQTLRQQEPDVLIILCATFSDASVAVELAEQVDVPVCLWALREPGPVGERLWFNSLCGANIASQALHKTGHDVQYIYGNPGEANLLNPLMAFARAAATRNRLRRSRVGLVGQAPTGFYGCQFDELELSKVIGTSVTQIDLESVFAKARDASPVAVEAVIASTAQRSPSLLTLNETHGGEVHRFGEAYVVLRNALRDMELDGLAVRCWPEFPQNFGLMPCATLGRLADDGFVCACEADMNGAVTLLLLQWLSGAAPLLADLVAIDEQKNTVSVWHCGNAPACLARDDQEPTLTVHCNRRIGVAGNFALRSGPATLARLGTGPHGYRLLFCNGTILDEPDNRFMGNTGVFRPEQSAQHLLDTIMRDGWEHHVAVVAGHIAQELAALAQLLHIEVVAL
ncbi:MAG TPA: hypothetical protein DHW02_19910 [Ktedonobacter sp.]|nr:hypothetical protein [Ktedonobacter sp.]